MQEPALVKSFGEIAYSLWALDKLGHISFADAVAQNFKKEGTLVILVEGELFSEF